MTSHRQSAIGKSVRQLIPHAPFYDTQAIRAQAAAKHLRSLPPEIAVWLSIIAYIRHSYTAYDRLRDEGYEREAARFFVCDSINEKLLEWRATRFLSIEEEAGAIPPSADIQ